jgi:hypothetical protein
MANAKQRRNEVTMLIGHVLFRCPVTANRALAGESKAIEGAYANECFDSTLKATDPLLPLLFLEDVPILLCFF